MALHALEDLGYYCIDNLPAALLKSAVQKTYSETDTEVERLAVGVDARNRASDIESLPRLVNELKELGVRIDIVFLDANDETLLQRYSESRRRHPLARHGAELRKAIAKERDLLAHINDAADLIIDTSDSSVYDLAGVLRERVDRRAPNTMSVLIESFGYKHRIPADADFVFDMRCLPNPYWNAELRSLTGLDQDVIDFLHEQPLFDSMYDDILSFLRRWIPRFRDAQRSYLTIAIGCTGGQHRSVSMTEKLAAALSAEHESVQTRHNGLLQHRIQPN